MCRSPTVSAKPSRPPAADCRSIRSGVSFTATSRATVSDAALEELVALGGAFHARSEPTGGRPATLWSAIQKEEREENEESGAEDDEPPVEE